MFDTYCHWRKGQLGLFVPKASEALGKALLAVDSAVKELENWRFDQADKKARGKK